MSHHCGQLDASVAARLRVRLYQRQVGLRCQCGVIGIVRLEQLQRGNSDTGGLLRYALPRSAGGYVLSNAVCDARLFIGIRCFSCDRCSLAMRCASLA